MTGKNKEKEIPQKRKKRKKPEKEGNSSENISLFGVEIIADRREYFTRLLKSQKIESVIGILSIIILTILAFVVVTTEKREVFFQVGEDNTQVELTPIHEPRYSNAFVADWVNKCLIETFDFYYGNYQDVLRRVGETCWSSNGTVSLQDALDSSGNIQAVQDRELFMQLVIDSTPVVARTSTPSNEDNPYRWMIQAEGSISLSSRTDTRGEDVEITVVVRRSSLQEKPVGLQIDQILLRN